ncbi:MAG: DivIVA domain-containing protein [Actinobacteria bacterium]|nr:DivIVA domain-containing protein [Actinomycetota bacterium]
MALTPMDIHNKEFKSARFGGYNEEDVDSFLDIIADEFEKMMMENGSMAVDLDTVRKKLAEFEEMQSSLQSALITASKSAEDVKEQSNREASLLLENARKEAEAIIRAAQEEAGRIITLARTEGQRIEKKFEKIRAVKSQYLDSMRQVAEAQLREIKELEEQDKRYNSAEQGIAAEDGSVNSMAPGNTTQAVQVAAPPAPEVVDIQERLPETVKNDYQNAPIRETESNPLEPQGGIATDQNSEGPPVTGAPAAPDTTASSQDIIQGRMKESSRPVIVEEMQMTSGAPGYQAVRQNEGCAAQVDDNNGKVATKTQDLVEEILGMEPGEDPYAEFGDIGNEDIPDGRKNTGRKEKKNKNKFWE